MTKAKEKIFLFCSPHLFHVRKNPSKNNGFFLCIPFVFIIPTMFLFYLLFLNVGCLACWMYQAVPRTSLCYPTQELLDYMDKHPECPKNLPFTFLVEKKTNDSPKKWIQTYCVIGYWNLTIAMRYLKLDTWFENALCCGRWSADIVGHALTVMATKCPHQNQWPECEVSNPVPTITNITYRLDPDNLINQMFIQEFNSEQSRWVLQFQLPK